MLSHALLESPWKGDFKKSKKVDSSQPLPDSPKNWSQPKNVVKVQLFSLVVEVHSSKIAQIVVKCQQFMSQVITSQQSIQ